MILCNFGVSSEDIFLFKQINYHAFRSSISFYVREKVELEILYKKKEKLNNLNKLALKDLPQNEHTQILKFACYRILKLEQTKLLQLCKRINDLV